MFFRFLRSAKSIALALALAHDCTRLHKQSRLSDLRNADNQFKERQPSLNVQTEIPSARNYSYNKHTKNVSYVITRLYSYATSIFSLFALKMMLETSKRRTTTFFIFLLKYFSRPLVFRTIRTTKYYKIVLRTGRRSYQVIAWRKCEK